MINLNELKRIALENAEKRQKNLLPLQDSQVIIYSREIK